jgi:hypothetical protein
MISLFLEILREEISKIKKLMSTGKTGRTGVAQVIEE